MKNTNEFSIRPYRSLFFLSMPCEHRAAAVFNEAKKSMKEKDSSAVAYRFLQSREGEKNSFTEASFYTALGNIMLWSARNSPATPRASLPILFLIAGNILPNIGNFIRYREIKLQSRQWLSGDLGEEQLAVIEALSYNDSGLNTLKNFFENENRSTVSIKNKKVHVGTLPCWNS